ncbi:phage tail protein [Deinococcus radiotolerans]|uniref:Uncharacterized protein n=1 Tax=Deinococcus radiotolerans TaxID=1309407 RepID=A0ABQ2FQ50_9DEIO|nr:phage tail protein [Deinococcus radiotolerans]GGL15970.1 hypothetical protein GCM10010844_38590 [Deinococcus radiotolerans]
MTVTYAAYLTRLSRINPIDYQDAGTQEHLNAVAASLEDVQARARAVMLTRLILSAPEDALTLMGAERGLRRFPDEPLATFRARVRGAWDYWRLAGTVPGMELILAQAGYRAVIVEHFRDPDPERWAEFSVVVQPLNPIVTTAKWGESATWGSGQHWGIDPNAVPTRYLPDLIRDFKPAHARLRRLTYFPRGRFWGSTAQWGEGRDLTPQPQPGWGVWTGYQTVTPAEDRTDSGAAWGESDAEIIYDLEGHHA